MNETLWDRVELDGLVMLDRKQGWLKQQADSFREHLSRIANYNPAGSNGVATAATPTVEPDVPGITNRSPRTSKSITNAAARSDGPWVALIVILMMVLLALGLAWWTSAPRHTTTTVVPAPVPPSPTPAPTPTPPPTSRDWIEFYRP